MADLNAIPNSMATLSLSNPFQPDVIDLGGVVSDAQPFLAHQVNTQARTFVLQSPVPLVNSTIQHMFPALLNQSVPFPPDVSVPPPNFPAPNTAVLQNHIKWNLPTPYYQQYQVPIAPPLVPRPIFNDFQT